MRNRIATALAISVAASLCSCGGSSSIDRKALISRNNPHITTIDTLASLTVGNGEFAFTADVTGLQTFPELYSKGVPLGTQSQWGWHSFPNTEGYTADEALVDYDFGRGRLEPYSVENGKEERNRKAGTYLRVNPHRLHLGAIGFADLQPEQVTDIDQTLDMWSGLLHSNFKIDNEDVTVTTAAHPDVDAVGARIKSSKHLPVILRFPYPTGGHCDDACNWDADSLHSIELTLAGDGVASICHTLDDTKYYVTLRYDGVGNIQQTAPNTVTITPAEDEWQFTATFSPTADSENPESIFDKSSQYWQQFWTEGGVVDFSACTDPRAKELERRVVLSQYLLATQCAGSTPPQETGLTYNSWFGKFHLEMIWWHQAQFALYNHPELLARTLPWYHHAATKATEIASRQGFKGLRWMKMTDPSAEEGPSKVGSFLIWQQPHLIYLAELLYRATGDQAIIDEYYPLVEETAQFMADFVDWDEENKRYCLHGIIPAQETLRASETINPPFELSYWHFGLSLAQQWCERKGLQRDEHYDHIINNLAKLAAKDTLYLAAETAPETYEDVRFTSDHMAVLGAVGVLPENQLIERDMMHSTFDWIYDNWNWDKTWGWDYPTTAMNATRMGEPDKAVNALLMDKRTNTYLPNGHNYQDRRLRCYLPGNGGLLTAIALMCAGWDGCDTPLPGFPKDGSWNVKFENIKPLP